MRFPEFAESEIHRGKTPGMMMEKDEEPGQTPEEILGSGLIRVCGSDLAQSLLSASRAVRRGSFETLVVDLLVAMGYGGSRQDAGQAVGQSANGGIDGIIKEDKLGLDVVYLQQRNGEGTVGRPVVQAFAGSLEGHGRGKVC